MRNSEYISIKEEGVIKETKKSIVKLGGFSSCRNGQLVRFSDNTKGMVMGFDEDNVLALFLENVSNPKIGDKVYTEGESFKIPVGDNFLGRIINSLCEPLDSSGAIKENDYFSMFREAPGVLDRVPIKKMLETGIRIIDASIPIGKGQRELILGDRMTGKTTLGVDTILNQKDKDVICIYCYIGNDYDSLKRIIRLLKARGALDYTIIIAATSSATSGEKYLAPYTAAALGEYFMHTGRDVFVVFDDLTKHAWAYREISLLLERPPGREAYPGDIFYVHSQLMERAGMLNEDMGGGSMTFFPIANTLEGDITGFIPTNLISMTDGQIYLESNLFNQGFKPAIDLSLSVSRIGSKVQSQVLKYLTKDLRLDYIQYKKLLEATRLKSGKFAGVAARLHHGEKVRQMFIQGRNVPMPLREQIVLFYALSQGMLDDLTIEECEEFKADIIQFVTQNHPDVFAEIDKQLLTDELMEKLGELIENYLKRFQSSDDKKESGAQRKINVRQQILDTRQPPQE
jgi:F-type H+-transporting ATPase subunit alpha